MRVLVISNVYPPYFIGGYELGCRDIVEGLRRRGHAVEVLTSWYGLEGPAETAGAHRLLHPDRFHLDRIYAPGSDWFSTRSVFRRERNDQGAFARVCRRFRPDLVYFWNMGFLAASLLFLPGRRRLPTAFYVSDEWPLRWQDDLWFERWQKRRISGPLKRFGLSLFASATGMLPFEERSVFHNVQFTSDAVRQAVTANIPVENGEVLHWGVDTEKFRPSVRPTPARTRLLYVGQLAPHKGVMTAAEAAWLLRDHLRQTHGVLTVVGGGGPPEYGESVRAFVRERGIDDIVRFAGRVDRESLPAVYEAHDVLIFPSVWDEPFSITMVEAMASGLVVVGTNTGGSRELLRHEETGLVFRPGDAEDCVCQLRRVFTEGELCTSMRGQAHEEVTSTLSLEKMLTSIEAFLAKARQHD